jgi:hypothetical protein
MDRLRSMAHPGPWLDQQLVLYIPRTANLYSERNNLAKFASLPMATAE